MTKEEYSAQARYRLKLVGPPVGRCDTAIHFDYIDQAARVSSTPTNASRYKARLSEAIVANMS